MSARSPFDLTGRTALVTGGNQGLGKAFAIGLASVTAGESTGQPPTEAVLAASLLSSLSAEEDDSPDPQPVSSRTRARTGTMSARVMGMGRSREQAGSTMGSPYSGGRRDQPSRLTA